MRQIVAAGLAVASFAVFVGCGGSGSGGGADGAALPSSRAATAANCAFMHPDSFVTRNDLIAGQRKSDAALLLRFLHYTDDHVLDDEGQAINGASPTDAINPVFEAAQRLQEEYTDEVLNSMIARSNDCTRQYPADFMIVTGDSADLTTVAEARRFIDNLDGTYDQMSAFEKACVAQFPAGTPEPVLTQACTRFTGRGVADTQSADADVTDPTVQFTLTRTLRQLANQIAAQFGRDADGNTDPTRQTFTRAPGMPQALRCSEGEPGCVNQALKTPWYIAFGNHDGYLRGTAPVGTGVNEASWLTTGRHHMQQQHEFIDEFYETRSLPKGHGFNFADAARRDDANPRNDGYYAFTVGKFRMVVLNTIIDGTDPRLPSDLVRNPFALSDGTVDQAQFAWMQNELKQAYDRKQLVMVFSHHADLTFAEFGMFAQAVPTDLTAAQVDAELASWPNVLAWVAGHTHRHRIRPFAITRAADGKLTGSNKAASGATEGIVTPVSCKVPGLRRDGRPHCNGFWQIETASLIDQPQEQRLIEVFDNRDGTATLRGPVLTHGFERSRKLAEADDRCQLFLLDPAGLQTLSSDAGVDALCKFGGTRQGTPRDRNVELMVAMPEF